MKRRFWSLVLCLCLMVGMGLHAGAVPEAWEQPLAVLYAGSDFQFPNTSFQGISYPDSYQAGAAVLKLLLKGIKKDYPSVDEALFLGDYEPSNYTSLPDGLYALQGVLEETWGLSRNEMLFLQGNHDNYDMPGLNGTQMVFNAHYNYSSKEGSGYIVPVEREHYAICMIHEDAFPETWVTDSAAIRQMKKQAVRETADALRHYLTVTLSGVGKPVIIMGHLPLHYARQDNIYARELVDALNAGASAGRNIIYLFGHNHSGGYDNYLGGSCIYYAPGAQIPVPDGTAADGGNHRYDTVSFGFTYLNAGYVGFVSSGEPGSTLSSTVLEIYGDRVELRRYNGKGLVSLKNQGCANTSGKGQSLTPDSHETPSPQTLELGKLSLTVTGEPEATLLTGGRDTASVQVSGAVGPYRVDWESSLPSVIQVEGSDTYATFHGVSEGIATVRAKVTDSTGVSKCVYFELGVRPSRAVPYEKGWLWADIQGSMLSGQTQTDAFVSLLTEGRLERIPVTADMLRGADTGRPGFYSCSILAFGTEVTRDFRLTVWDGDAASPVRILRARDLYYRTELFRPGRQYALVGVAPTGEGRALGIRRTGQTYRSTATPAEMFRIRGQQYAAIGEDACGWLARWSHTASIGFLLKNSLWDGYLKAGSDNRLTLTTASVDARLWTFSGGVRYAGVPGSARKGILCTQNAFYTGSGSNVSVYQKDDTQRLVTYGYATAVSGTVRAKTFGELLLPGGEAVLVERLSSDGSEVSRIRIPITVDMLPEVSIRDLMRPGTHHSSVWYGNCLICEDYVLTVTP